MWWKHLSRRDIWRLSAGPKERSFVIMGMRLTKNQNGSSFSVIIINHSGTIRAVIAVMSQLQSCSQCRRCNINFLSTLWEIFLLNWASRQQQVLLSKGLSVVANIWTMDHTRTFLTHTEDIDTTVTWPDKYKLVKIKIKVNQNNANDATQLAPIT